MAISVGARGIIRLRTICVIPARGGSKGLPRKNLRCLNGIPLVSRAILAAQQVETISDIFVTTDSEEIAREARDVGASVPFLRSKSLSEDHTTTEDTLKDALFRIEEILKFEADLVVYISPSEGFVNESAIRNGIEKLKQDELLESYFPTTPTFKNFWVIEDEGPTRVMDSMREYSSRQKRKLIYREDTGRGCVSRAGLWRLGRRIGDRIAFEVDYDLRANLDIHDETDLNLAEFVLGKLGDKEFYNSYAKRTI